MGLGSCGAVLACQQDPEEAAGGGTDQRASRTTTTTQVQVRTHSARTAQYVVDCCFWC